MLGKNICRPTPSLAGWSDGRTDWPVAKEFSQKLKLLASSKIGSSSCLKDCALFNALLFPCSLRIVVCKLVGSESRVFGKSRLRLMWRSPGGGARRPAEVGESGDCLLPRLADGFSGVVRLSLAGELRGMLCFKLLGLVLLAIGRCVRSSSDGWTVGGVVGAGRLGRPSRWILRETPTDSCDFLFCDVVTGTC